MEPSTCVHKFVLYITTFGALGVLTLSSPLDLAIIVCVCVGLLQPSSREVRILVPILAA